MKAAAVLACIGSLLMVQTGLAAEGDSDTQRQRGGVVVTYDHERETPTHAGVVRLKEGETLTIRIVNTSTRCFAFNYVTKDVTPPSGDPQADRAKLTFNEPFAFAPIVHDGRQRDYIVTITKRDKNESACDQRSERPESNPWVINVRTYGWS